MKKCFALLLVFIISVSFATLGIADDETTPVYTSGNYTYMVNADGNAVITQYTGEDEIINVPAALDGYAVVEIGEEAFYYNESLTSIILPDSLQSIDTRAFCECSSLTSIEWPDNLQSIGAWAFAECSSLVSINLPDSLQSIDHDAFIYCDALTSITLPASLQSIDDNLFFGCMNLTSIEVSADNLVFTAEDGVLFNKEEQALIAYPAGKTDAEYSVPQGIQAIYHGAFAYCALITSVNLPDGLLSIGGDAFFLCESLTSINLPDSLQSDRDIGGNLFYGCDSLTLIVSQDSYAHQYAEEMELPFQFAD